MEIAHPRDSREGINRFVCTKALKSYYTANNEIHYWVAMANPVGICISFVCFIHLFLFSVSVKVLPVTPLLSGVFVHRAFRSYFLVIERVVEMHRFLWWTL